MLFTTQLVMKVADSNVLKNSFETLLSNLQQRWVSQMRSGLELVGRPTARQRFITSTNYSAQINLV